MGIATSSKICMKSQFVNLRRFVYIHGSWLCLTRQVAKNAYRHVLFRRSRRYIAALMGNREERSLRREALTTDLKFSGLLAWMSMDSWSRTLREYNPVRSFPITLYRQHACLSVCLSLWLRYSEPSSPVLPYGLRRWVAQPAEHRELSRATPCPWRAE